MKKLHLYLGSILAAATLLAACGQGESGATAPGDEEKIQVIATLFPQYDFARQIGGDRVEVSKLLAPGVNPHTFDPSPQDVITLNNADLFIYTGADMEPWVQQVVGNIDGDVNILDVSDHAALIPWGGASEEDHDHDHDDEADVDDHDHDDEADVEDHDHDHDDEAVVDDHDHDHDDEDVAEHHHSHDYDPHIWTSPVNAIVMANNVLDALIAISPEDEAYFRANAETLIGELESLDADFREMVAGAQRHVIYHAGNFAAAYLTAEYGLDYVAAPNETEPSAALVAQMIDEINTQDIPVIFYEELVDPQIANMIASETGAQALLLHTAHNLSNDDFQSGVTYVDLMRQNLENLRIALN